MRIEIRKFRKTRHLLLTIESEEEASLLDIFFGDDETNFHTRTIQEAKLCTDDTYRPYIRIESNKLI